MSYDIVDVLREAAGDYSMWDKHMAYDTIEEIRLLREEADRLRAENESLKQDAERYRWLTLNSDANSIMVYEVSKDRLLFGYEADEAIDAALAAKGGDYG